MLGVGSFLVGGGIVVICRLASFNHQPVHLSVPITLSYAPPYTRTHHTVSQRRIEVKFCVERARRRLTCHERLQGYEKTHTYTYGTAQCRLAASQRATQQSD
jgi:hypothetical protein